VADEAEIRRVLESKMNGAKIEGVEPAPVAPLYEVRYRTPEGVHILYTDAKAKYIITGAIHESGSARNLTEERKRKLNALKFSSLPLELAVKVQRGNGKRVIAMFSDPYCPACRRFERSLQEIDDITIYVFMYPVIRPEIADHSRAVWCSQDRAKAWLELAAAPTPKVPTARIDCEDAVDKVLKYGRTLGINSTPTLILSNGERITGGLSAPKLLEALDEAAKP